MSKTACRDFLDPPSKDFIGSLISIIHFQVDLETMIFSFDRNFSETLGLPPIATLSQQEFLEQIPRPDQRFVQFNLTSVKAGNSNIMNRGLRLFDGKGKIRHFECRSRVEQATDNSQRKTLKGIFVDISERQVKQPALSESEKLFKAILEESPHAMYRIDIKRDRFDYISRGFAKTLGRSQEEILALPYSEFCT
ncbi:MAG: PAS domain-containing protein [Candidatus Riflebacteria bacterium]|nr:PAS domain-containing protein [Candidatus Riflebacteria bacterium]